MTRSAPASEAAIVNVGLITWNDISAVRATGGRLPSIPSCCAMRMSLARAEMARPIQIAQPASSGMKIASAGTVGDCHTAVATTGLAPSQTTARKIPNTR
ncbi:MAG TPA: hypothetical protein VGN41_00275 [Streptosporangiaceae bacterium]|jgi:hypothetical protein